jgi:hypothetical protein
MTDPIVERGKPRPKTVSRAYFADGSPASLELEAMLDRVGLVNVLRALSDIANAKAVYVAEHWQDCSRAKQWASDAAQVDTLADTLERAWAILAFEASERARDALNSDQERA